MNRKDTIDVWVFPLDGAPELAVGDTLSAEELDRASRFRFEHLRRAYVIAHVMLREVLSRYTNIRPAELNVATRPGGKPFLRDAVDIDFSLSHTEGLAAIAVAANAKVGVDIEKMRPVDQDFAALIGARDAREVKALPCEDQLAAMFRCWTRKEALLKGVGLGLLDDLDVVSVGVAASCKVDSSHAEIDAGRWAILDLDAPVGYVGAIAANAPQMRVEYRQMSFTR